MGPYNDAFDNPLRFIDSDGMGPTTVIITGDDAKAAFIELQKISRLNLSRHETIGIISARGKAKSKADKKLRAAIDDPKRVVNLNPTKKYSSGTDSEPRLILVGEYNGSHREGEL